MTVDLSLRMTLSWSISFPQDHQIRSASARFSRLYSRTQSSWQKAEGGTLEFGLRHVYPIKDDLNHIYKILKGSDAVVYQSVLALGYEPFVHYGERGVMIDKAVHFSRWECVFASQQVAPMVNEVVQVEGGVSVRREGAHIALEVDIQEGIEWEGVEWVTQVTGLNRQTDAVFTGYTGDEAAMEWVYGDVRLVIRVGKAGDRSRLAYRTVAQLGRAYKDSDTRVDLSSSIYY